MAPDQPFATAKNPEGRVVEISLAKWHHVVERHPYLMNSLTEVLETIETPDYRELDPRPGRLRYVRFVGRRTTLRVVTEFAGDTDRLITAFYDAQTPR